MIVLYGAGGHGRVVAEALGEGAAFWDDDPAKATLKGYPLHCKGMVVTIGRNADRRGVVRRLGEGTQYARVVHARAWVSPTAEVGAGTVVLAGAVVNAGAKIGEHVIVNSGAVVEHDCVVEDFAHVCPGATMCGGSRLTEGKTLPAGMVLPHGATW